MNLFRSEEHAQAWDGFNAERSATLQPVAFWADLFSNPIFRERLRPDYISWLQSEEAVAARTTLGGQFP